MRRFFILSLAVISMFLMYSCDENTSGPNVIGGETNLDYTKPGSELGVYLATQELKDVFGEVDDSVVVVSNDDGIVTTKCIFTFTQAQYDALNTYFGINSIPEATKTQMINKYLEMFGGTIDTSNKNARVLSFTLTHKITSEGIQGFTYTGDKSKPFTIVKYSSNVGDTYSVTDKDGKNVTRTVIEKNPVEDWKLVFWTVKTIKVEEPLYDPILEKIVYVANHKYGMVGMKVYFKSGKLVTLDFVPWEAKFPGETKKSLKEKM